MNNKKKIFSKSIKKVFAVIMSFAFFAVMLPTNATTVNAAERVADPVPSIVGGYYDEAITITLSSSTPGAVIYYINDDTTDFSRGTWDCY